MDRLEMIEKGLEKRDVPQFRVGDTVRVHVNVVEGDKKRIQIFEGTVIGIKGRRNRETFTVRKISYGVSVERIFPVHSPAVERVEVVREGKVRRAKLYYLRYKRGKDARIAEKRRVTTEKKDIKEQDRTTGNTEEEVEDGLPLTEEEKGVK